MTDSDRRIQLNGWGPVVAYVGLVTFLVAGVSGGIIATSSIDTSPNPPALPACETEDSDNCWWDATEHGNGEGLSFVVIEGEVTYLAPTNR
ncbi:hypothetical protein SEA_MARCIE_107 [Microbacterium phage Marcie]|nr:hypothetical protein SEA_MARCIE_107 [Microbacterium phage Marcie]